MTSKYIYRTILGSVGLFYLSQRDAPSLQMARWAAQTLTSGEYRVHYRIDGNYEIVKNFSTTIPSPTVIATWPDPGILGEPKPLDGGVPLAVPTYEFPPIARSALIDARTPPPDIVNPVLASPDISKQGKR
jgi:hypothetical protein